MKCPYCGKTETSVIDSREAEEVTSIRRRRHCDGCGKRFTTYERIEGIELKVLKKNGTKEQFSREKLRRGIIKATWKRPVSMNAVELLLDEVERKLRQKEVCEVKSWEIGNLVINRLKRIDPLSYLLFASVYRDFESIEDFEKEIVTLKNPSSLNNANQ
ncbi:transcriptional repressor NrdR [Candidatus Woesebacteria bacterium]|nr:transcriptional repressor NrdR [Candidatus Woesebacteria bacterium]